MKTYNSTFLDTVRKNDFEAQESARVIGSLVIDVTVKKDSLQVYLLKI